MSGSSAFAVVVYERPHRTSIADETRIALPEAAHLATVMLAANLVDLLPAILDRGVTLDQLIVEGRRQ